ncbi:dihydrofolate reductase family protein [Anaeromyxobacter sp. PSR-1]|uniref:dihydrofolate reductase family protein n=1 Tax=Anaeromyxobacter sp. PSR-1 TaxID=1300915 RepID=UPI0005E12872|nr:dihydrofolate reductase family protein [Anaeromyxobacter sp. PSR-1]GAO03697.1 putative protein [Anaeromyxobacter sp. PSR-1]
MATKTRYYVAATLDGFIADPDGGLGWLMAFNDAEGVEADYQAFVGEVGALAMGAATYEFVLGEGMAWPYEGRPTWVFTHRALPAIPGADLRFTSAAGGALDAVHDEMVRAARGRDVWLVGGGKLAAQFAARGLLDELQVSVVPVVLGAGVPLLPAALPGTLALTELKRFGRGLVQLRYAVPRAG